MLNNATPCLSMPGMIGNKKKQIGYILKKYSSTWLVLPPVGIEPFLDFFVNILYHKGFPINSIICIPGIVQIGT